VTVSQKALQRVKLIENAIRRAAIADEHRDYFVFALGDSQGEGLASSSARAAKIA
jgi:hypothetical protein